MSKTFNRAGADSSSVNVYGLYPADALLENGDGGGVATTFVSFF